MVNRTKKEFAEHGIGMYRYRKCRCEICSAAMRAERRKYRKVNDDTNVKLSFAPMEQWLTRRGYMDLVENTSVRRWREKGVSIYTIDSLCVRYGVHPAQVYGSAFYSGCFDEEFAA